jgi:type IV pilus assembly protein PilQ
MKSVALCLALLGCLPATARAETAPVQTTRLTEVTVIPQAETTIVHLKTSGAARYRTELISSPARLVLDLDDTVYDWRRMPLQVGQDPIKEIRGSQYRKGVARVVMEFTRKVDYEIRESAEGLTVSITRGTRETTPAAARGAQTAPASPPARVTTPAVAAIPASTVSAPPVSTTPESQAAEAPRQPAGSSKALPADDNAIGPTLPPRGADQQPGAAARREPYRVAATIATESSDRGRAVPAPRPVPPAVAQATAAPAAVSSPGNGQRLISLDFKDADVVNLLRILAAESGRNIVIGEDVKGKMSISLRNVPWQLALETVLESRGLQKVEKDDVIRIVSTDQLTKEREARARVEEAKLKGEAEVRAKFAEAQVKEAEAQIRKLSAEAAQREQEARGPLREETLRLSYADPEEVAKTLQGILGIPAEGQKIQGPGIISGPFPEPPFSQLFGPQAGGGPAGSSPVMSVSQDVLSKGLSIRAHKPTNTLFVRLYQADLERVKKIIRESLDIPLPQVKIEARMEILDRNALEQIGIQWGGLTASNVGSSTLVGQGLQTVAGPGGQTVPIVPGFQQGNVIVIDPTSVRGLSQGSLLQNNRAFDHLGGLPVSFQTGLPLGGNLINLPISALPNAGPLPAAGLAFGLIGKKFNINLALQALASTGKTRTLARPEIVTVENNKAVMSLGEEIPYATISSAGTQIQFKEALLKLEVTPTVIREGDDTKIKMLVVVENNSRGDVVNLGNAGQPPAINRRKAETQVLIREGDRLIIGGVLTSVNQNTVRKVPVFGDIPLLGHLFKQRENFETGRELVVFLTPTVIRPAERTAGAPAPAVPTPPPTR